MLFGYGFFNVGQTSIPADLQVTIGGKSVQVTAFNPNAFNSEAAPSSGILVLHHSRRRFRQQCGHCRHQCDWVDHAFQRDVLLPGYATNPDKRSQI